MPIGTGRQRDGVYFLGEAPVKVQSNAVRTSELWHKRMGHPSSEVMSMFAKDLDFLDYVSNKNTNKLECNYMLVKIKPVIYSKLFIAIYEDPIVSLHHVEPPIF